VNKAGKPIRTESVEEIAIERQPDGDQALM
jgi:hypothetical protein